LDKYIKDNMANLNKGGKAPDAIKNGEERFIQLQLSIIDSGIGISEEGLKKLFIDFSKLDENSKRNCQGTGLGLSICKNIIEQMGGKVEVKSVLGQGTSFVINLKTHCIIRKVKVDKIKKKLNRKVD
jgi:signal transduction histidine kinase